MKNHSLYLISAIFLASMLSAFAGEEGSSDKTDSDKTKFELSITRNLVRLEEGKLARVPQESLTSKDYYAIYYSAQWCPPCRKFTPKLVDFYNEAIGHHDNIEVIFVSSDQSEKKMEEYMEKTGMRWLALDYDKKDKKSSEKLNSFVGRGIPHLVVLDKNGKILSDSIVDGEYRGPYAVLEEFIELLH